MAYPGLTIREGADAPRMSERTTLRLGGPVLAEVLLTEAKAVPRLMEIAARLGGRPACLGAGSNILAGEGPLPLVLVRDASPPDIDVLDDDGERVLLRAAASVKLPLFLGHLRRMNLGGLEGLTGIPGTVGGAVAMNAGSYGQCAADTLASVIAVTADGTLTTVPREEISFAYRRMSLPIREWHMIIAACFSLTRCEEPGRIDRIARETMARKKASQPVTEASAGCVFKNPSTEMPAGKLLEEAGFKGKRLGGMAFSGLHANFLINEDRGTSAEALELLAAAKEAVFQRHGVTLEPEVRIWV